MTRTGHFTDDYDDDQLDHAEMTGRDDDQNRHVTHDQALADRDRAARHHDQPPIEVPSARERREHYDETRVQNLLRPRTGHVEVQPATSPVCTCNARKKTFRHPGHLYRCPMYSRYPNQDAA